MPLEGLRAWIGEVERKLGMRTRVFLVLSVIALGGAGAAIYLAIDARESSVSESDVQALQERLEARIDEVAAGGAATAPLEAPTEAESIPAPAPEESKPQPESEGEGAGGQGSGGGGTSNGATGGASSGASGTSNGALDEAEGSARLKELVQQAQGHADGNE